MARGGTGRKARGFEREGDTKGGAGDAREQVRRTRDGNVGSRVGHKRRSVS
jgi:hypothetical protein